MTVVCCAGLHASLTWLVSLPTQPITRLVAREPALCPLSPIAAALGVPDVPRLPAPLVAQPCLLFVLHTPQLPT